jgi:hypothetical protein
MRPVSLALLALMAAGPALANDVPAPIREVMEVTAIFWSPQQPKLGSIFNEDRLKRLYSADFVRRYRAAMKHPIYPNGDTPFDFDVVVQAQDSCTPEDIDMHLFKTDGGMREYEVSFVRLGCFDGGDPKERTTIYFDIISEGGRDVIDDIATYEENGRKDSTKVLMVNIAEGQPDRLYEPPR